MNVNATLSPLFFSPNCRNHSNSTQSRIHSNFHNYFAPSNSSLSQSTLCKQLRV